MTVQEALSTIQQVGTVEARSGNLKIRFPQPERKRLQPAIAFLRNNKAEALAAISTQYPSAESENWPWPRSREPWLRMVSIPTRIIIWPARSMSWDGATRPRSTGGRFLSWPLTVPGLRRRASDFRLPR